MQFFACPRSPVQGETFREDGAADAADARAAYRDASKMTEDEAKELVRGVDSVQTSASNFGRLLGAAAVIGRSDLGRKEKKNGRTLSAILEAQCDHYSFLRNHSLRLAQMTKQEQAENPTGSATNEALHREVGGLGAGVYL